MIIYNLRLLAVLLLATVLTTFPFSAVAATPTQAAGFEIGPGLNDAWYNPDTAGQGFLITVLPETGIVFLAWFTYDTEQANNVGTAELGEPNHRWLTAQGSYSGDTAALDISVTSGGAFDADDAVSTQAYGTMTLSFEDCNSGVIEYEIPSVGKTGTIPIQRVVTDNVEACEHGGSSAQRMAMSSAPADQSGLINTGINDAWFNPATSGQGFLVTVLPKAGIVFLAWFTHEVAEASGTGEAHLGDARHRWVTAQGPYTDNRAELNITVSSGGVFDTPSTVTNHPSGTLTLDLFGCNAGQVSYDIPAIGRQGQVPIQRVVGDNVGRCEAQATITEAWNYWKHADVKGLDDWGEQSDTHPDLVALYQKDTASGIALRVDYMDLTSGSLAPTFLGLDFKTGGTRNVLAGNNQHTLDLDWDVLIVAEGTAVTAFDAGFNELPGAVTNVTIDRSVDYLSFDLDGSALNGWSGSAFNLQALTTNSGKSVERDRTAVSSTDDAAGTGILILPIMNVHGWSGPADIAAYDGSFWAQFTPRPQENGGWKYLLDAVEKYEIPIQLNVMNREQLPALEQLGLTDRLRELNKRGLVDLLFTTYYGQLMPWWSDEINVKAVELSVDARQAMDLPVSGIVYPYEGLMRVRDLKTLKDLGFDAVWGLDTYRSWFGDLDPNGSDAERNAEMKQLRKPQLVNGMTVFFDTMVNNYGGFVYDQRWQEPDFSIPSHYSLSEGTDQGLHTWLRRTLLDMALEEDREQFFTFGTDLVFLAWMFAQEADSSFKWLASHPWIEVAHFSDIASRGWTPVDHGTLDIAADELLMDYQNPDNQKFMYQPYFAWSYYGGVANDGTVVEGVFDYVPYLRDGQPIPNGMQLGDFRTPNTLIGETFAQLQSAPDNVMRSTAWDMFFAMTRDITTRKWETGEVDEYAKYGANYVGHVGKITAAAQWADDSANGRLSADTQAEAVDLDLDGEDEYILSNEQVFAVFENDGGHLEYAFVFHPDTGPIQLVAPSVQRRTIETRYEFYESGEVASREINNSFSGAFSDRGNPDDLTQSVMNATVGADFVIFETAGGEISKTFRLSGDAIIGSYSLDGVSVIEPQFCLAPNMAAMFNRDWASGVQPVDPQGSNPGWESSYGGRATVSLENVNLSSMFSFLDSPTPQERREREDVSTYPNGHWSPIPFGCITTINRNGDKEFDIELRLQALSSNFDME